MNEQNNSTPLDAALTALAENIAQPKSAEVDGQKVEQHSLRDQIEALRFLAGASAARSGKLGIRISKMQSGGGIR